MKKLCKSSIGDSLKGWIFRATIYTIYTYGDETLTTKTMTIDSIAQLPMLWPYELMNVTPDYSECI